MVALVLRLAIAASVLTAFASGRQPLKLRHATNSLEQHAHEKIRHDTRTAVARKSNFTALDPVKLSWIHVPKAGTSFSNVLVTWGCPSLPDDATVDESYSNKDGMFVPGFMQAHRAQCAKGMTLCGSGHLPIAKGSCNDWEGHKGQFVAMFRQPEQRTLSGFFHNRHDINDKTLDLIHYADKIAGCSVRMLNGEHCGGDRGDGGEVTQAMVDTAVDRLETGFAFVGLVDQWALSVCLFHQMFGGPCHKREFADVRPGQKHSNSSYDTTDLHGWKDSYDGALYDRAYVLFWSNAAKYNASAETCQSICPNAPKGAFGL